MSERWLLVRPQSRLCPPNRQIRVNSGQPHSVPRWRGTIIETCFIFTSSLCWASDRSPSKQDWLLKIRHMVKRERLWLLPLQESGCRSVGNVRLMSLKSLNREGGNGTGRRANQNKKRTATMPKSCFAKRICFLVSRRINFMADLKEAKKKKKEKFLTMQSLWWIPFSPVGE